MKKFISLAVILATQFVLLAPVLSAQTKAAQNLHVSGAYIRTMPPGRTTTAGFLTITNHGTADCKVISASSPLSDRIEFHEHLHSDGMIRMRPVDGGIVLSAGETVVFKPGGLHIMLFNVEQALVGGDSTQFVFNTDHCGSVQFSAEVHSLKSAPMAKKHH
jgi:copper(I)-binding protein